MYTERKAIFDVYCENELGEKFIVEMQNAYQTYFKDRSLFYSTFPIREQAPKGSDWNFCLKKVYVVALLNYKMSDEAFDSSDTIHTIALMDTKTNKVFNAKLMFGKNVHKNSIFSKLISKGQKNAQAIEKNKIIFAIFSFFIDKDLQNKNKYAVCKICNGEI